ncbi:helix-turn-helix transcriptional regulator [Siccationidurans soli]|uniref:Helix-turn-helix transcriptional regulator n=2 Tax=Hymenobacter negativus TaxID=2795026 RepID=A0ABS3QJ34_9BACT|nr:helix-turn-helix transcriptional regulator [Hymenobacter negativus]
MLKNGKSVLLDVNSRRYYCQVELAMDLLGGKWKGVILWYLQGDTLRFTELRKRIVTISEKMLIRELRELEKAGLITRKVYPEVPPKVEYSLSDFGQTLAPLLSAVSDFGMSYALKFGQQVEE